MRKKTLKMKKLSVRHKVLFVGLLLIVVPLLGISGNAATDAELAEQYAPILYFEAGETCYPVDVSYHIENSHLYDAEIDQAINMDPTANTLSIYTADNFYLDNQKGTIEDDGIINDYQSQMSSLGYTVYYQVIHGGESTIIQYWMFYAFNKGELNQHEGDWEMVQVVLSGGSPTSVMYSQHHSGQNATWEQVEKDGDHIKVYVARGSHANYLRSFSGTVGIANDYVGSNGKVLQPSDYQDNLEVLDESKEWLVFGGRWGAWTNPEDDYFGLAGPPGPRYRTDQNHNLMWDGLTWGNSLPQADDNIFLLEWFVYNFVMIYILITIVVLCVLGYRVYKRHKKYGLGPRIVSMLYVDGPNLKSIGNILCIVGIIVAFIALFGSWYAVSYSISSDANFESFQTEGMTDLISVDGITGIQLTVPGQGGPTPMGSFALPFSLVIAIGLIFTILATIGVAKSGKLGGKYIWRGVKVLLPVIIIVIIFVLIGSLISGMIPDTGEAGGNAAMDVFNQLSSSPLGGQGTIPVTEGDVTGQIDLQWGLGQGGLLLLVAGIILIIAGALEISANAILFEPKGAPKPKKIPEPKKPEKVEEKKEKNDDKK